MPVKEYTRDVTTKPANGLMMSALTAKMNAVGILEVANARVAAADYS
jgi:hypothetical protein